MKLLTIKEAASQIGACEWTIRKMARQGELACVRRGEARRGRHFLRIPQTAIDKWIQRNTENAV